MASKTAIAFAEAFEAMLQQAIQGAGSAAVAEEPEAEEPVAAAPKRSRKSKKAVVTLEDVRGALVALAEAKDKQSVVEVLSRFGVAKIGDLAEENYAECKEAAEAEAAADDEGESEDEDDPFA